MSGKPTIRPLFRNSGDEGLIQGYWIVDRRPFLENIRLESITAEVTVIPYTARIIAVSFLTTWLCIWTPAQSDFPATPPKVEPEAAFISPLKYANAFFGFSMPLPKAVFLRPLATSPIKVTAASHLLLGILAERVAGFGFADKPKLTTLVVVATQSKSDSAEEAQKAASGPKGHDVKQVEIGGRKFWESELQQKEPEGKMWDVTFATPVDGYVLQFHIASFDGKLTDQLEHCIEAISFFDPSKAEEMAGPNSRAYKSTTLGQR